MEQDDYDSYIVSLDEDSSNDMQVSGKEKKQQKKKNEAVKHSRGKCQIVSVLI